MIKYLESIVLTIKQQLIIISKKLIKTLKIKKNIIRVKILIVFYIIINYSQKKFKLLFILFLLFILLLIIRKKFLNCFFILLLFLLLLIKFSWRGRGILSLELDRESQQLYYRYTESIYRFSWYMPHNDQLRQNFLDAQ